MILKSWKDIAKYLGCGVRTVQRWEMLGMPVRRPTGHRPSAVVAISDEIDAWLKRDSPATGPSALSEAMPHSPHKFRYRILVADDDEVLLNRLAARLADEGYDVRTARDGFEALAAMREALPDLLVSAVRMPNMSGFELLSVVRRRFPGVSVIALSGEFTQAKVPDILCDQYIEKGPNSLIKWVAAIRALLARSPLRAQPAKIEKAPVWFPRTTNGYIVLTCPNCLRSFPLMARPAVVGKDTASACDYCGEEIKYHIDNSDLPIADDLRKINRGLQQQPQSKYEN